jgi:hypothetical protein
MPIQVRGVLVHAMSGTELSRVRTEFRLRLPEPLNKNPLESRRPTLLCNHVESSESPRIQRNLCMPVPTTSASQRGGSRNLENRGLRALQRAGNLRVARLAAHYVYFPHSRFGHSSRFASSSWI